MRYEFRAARIRSPGSGLVELDMVGHVVAFGKGDCAVRGARNGQVDVPAIGFDALFAAPEQAPGSLARRSDWMSLARCSEAPFGCSTRVTVYARVAASSV